MIEDALVFALGALVAGLLALVLFPAFTRRAARLARRDAEAVLPRSMSEIAAARDAVRAVYAAKTAKVESDLEGVRAALAAERLARAAGEAELSAARGAIHALKIDLAEAEARTEAVRADLRQREEALARSAVERRDLDHRHHAEMERRRAAEERAEEVAAIATEMRLALAASEARSVSLEEALRGAVPASVPPSSAAEAIDAEWAPAEPAPADPAPPAADAARVPTVRIDPANDRAEPEPAAAPVRPGRDRARDAVSPRLDTWPTLEPRAVAVPDVRPPTDADAAAFGLPAGPAPVREAMPDRRRDKAEPTLGADADQPADFPALPAPATVPAVDYADPAERSRRVEDLARRLKHLRTWNAAARGRGDGPGEESDGATAGNAHAPAAEPEA